LFACAAVVTVLVVLLFQTRFGISVTAVNEDELTAELMGLSVRGIQTSAFALGSGIAALAGALYAHHFSYIEAQSYGVVFSIYIVLYVLLGGTQTAYGPLVGASVFTLLPEILRGSASWRYVVFALAILAVVAWRPQGLITRDLFRRGPQEARGASPAAQP